MTLNLDVATLIIASIPMLLSCFSGAWALLDRMVFRPLTEISHDLKDIKVCMDHHANRLTIAEARLDALEKSFEDT
jgi:hypothetical protein